MFQQFSCDDNSEILKRWIQLEETQNYLRKNAEEKFLEELEILEQHINASNQSKEYFQKLQDKIASDLSFRNSLSSNIIKIIMSLQLSE